MGVYCMDIKKELKKINVRFALLSLFVVISLVLNINSYLKNPPPASQYPISNIVRIRDGD